MPSPPMSPGAEESVRISFPVQTLPTPPASGSSDTHWDRVSLQRRREKQVAQQKERQENEWLQAHQKERELEWRITAIKERLRRDKLEKEKGTAEVVADSDEQQQGATIYSSVAAEGTQLDSPGSPGYNSSSNRTSTDVEQRLKRLEKSGDAYLRIMVPLLENMNRTLTEMRKDGIAGGLTMGLNMNDFVLDMHAETKRASSIVDGPLFSAVPSAAARRASAAASLRNNENVRQSVLQHRRDRSGSKSSQVSAASSQKMSARVEMNMSRPRSRRNTQTSGSHSRGGSVSMSNKSGESTRRSNDTYHTGRSSPADNSSSTIDKKPLPSVPQSPSPPQGSDLAPPPASKELPLPPSPMMQDGEQTPRTPREHQLEAQQAIQRRIDEQGAIFDQLMSGWGVVDSKRSSRTRSLTLPSSKPANTA
ncbi:hypothetical protein Micbo1qcDRAFT_158830 [Microdochium bolleyi]|uniref:Uncharacterized protein n=1 Tax=Microdochium bolleyi TaxID=196109 RepID=A0A136J9U9_9PEZI|nr:hypothetical protein Micbo1qcDRAFT_158830 [Microdochium bolleyi]